MPERQQGDTPDCCDTGNIYIFWDWYFNDLHEKLFRWVIKMTFMEDYKSHEKGINYCPFCGKKLDD